MTLPRKVPPAGWPRWSLHNSPSSEQISSTHAWGREDRRISTQSRQEAKSQRGRLEVSDCLPCVFVPLRLCVKFFRYAKWTLTNPQMALAKVAYIEHVHKACTIKVLLQLLWNQLTRRYAVSRQVTPSPSVSQNLNEFLQHLSRIRRIPSITAVLRPATDSLGAGHEDRSAANDGSRRDDRRRG